MRKSTERALAYAFGVVFIASVMLLATLFPEPTHFQYLVFRVVLALSAAGVATVLTGFIEIEVSKRLKAGGALAVFAILFFYNPAALVTIPPDSRSVAIPEGAKFGQVVKIIVESEQAVTSWGNCPRELRDAPVEAGSITADNSIRLIAVLSYKIVGPHTFAQATNTERGVYEMHCN